MSKKTIIGLVVLVIVLIMVILIGKKAGVIGSEAEKLISAVEVERTNLIETVTATGKIYPHKEVKISSEVPGEILTLNVEEGDSVSKGDLLIVINPDILNSSVLRVEAGLNQSRANAASSDANVKLMEANLSLAKANYDRNQELFAKNIVSKLELENTKSAYETALANLESALKAAEAARYNVKSAQASLSEANDNLSRTRIYAPISGIISLLNVEEGEKVVGTSQMAGTELLRVADFSKMHVRVDVSESDVIKVKIGDTAAVEADAWLDRSFSGTVTKVAYSSASDQINLTDQSTNFQVEIELLKPSYQDLLSNGMKVAFRPGMSATAEIQTSKRKDVLVVPIQSVTVRKEDDDSEELKQLVFVINGDTVSEIVVGTGIQDDEQIEILSGIEKGMQVVDAPYKAISKELKQGDLIKVVTKDELFDKSAEE